MEPTLLLNKLAISRWAVEYLNAAQSGGVNAGMGEKGDPRPLSKTERALYESSLEMLNRFVAGEFEFDPQRMPEPPEFHPSPPEFIQQFLVSGNRPPPPGQPTEGQAP